MTAGDCAVCGEHSLTELERFASLPRVTSDTKPWPSGGRLQVCSACGAVQKPADGAWLSEIEKIYSAYEIYKLSNGGEQVIFDESGIARERSSALVDVVLGQMSAPVQGNLIDLGCGNGSAIKSFSRILPHWNFDGTEFSSLNIESLRTIPGFRNLYTGAVDGRYDVVSMIHSLEHMISPMVALADAIQILEPEGRLLVEVPNVETSLFDILVADHRMHFSRSTLARLASRCEIEPLILSDAILPKELTLVARPGSTSSVQNDDATSVIQRIDTVIGWLHQLISSAKRAANATTSFGIFGTSISGMWLFGAMPEHVEFFVDEDPSRIGQQIEGRPILSPEQVANDSDIFVPLVPSTARRVIDRLAIQGGRYLMPPPILAAA